MYIEHLFYALMLREDNRCTVKVVHLMVILLASFSIAKLKSPLMLSLRGHCRVMLGNPWPIQQTNCLCLLSNREV